eukprot:4330941-Amphidinium_carterae.1
MSMGLHMPTDNSSNIKWKSNMTSVHTLREWDPAAQFARRKQHPKGPLRFKLDKTCLPPSFVPCSVS